MTTLTSERKLYRITEAARLLGLSRSTMYALIWRGELPVVRIGRTTRIAADDLDALVRRHRVGGDGARTEG